jgi:hypothetical protein
MWKVEKRQLESGKAKVKSVCEQNPKFYYLYMLGINVFFQILKLFMLYGSGRAISIPYPNLIFLLWVLPKLEWEKNSYSFESVSIRFE